MKPLELTVYPHVVDGGMDCIEDSEGTFRIHRELDDFAQAKRFTDAELAAEYWRLRLKVCSTGNQDMKAVGHVCVKWQAAHDELDTMQRFMDLPHYDQEEDNT